MSYAPTPGSRADLMLAHMRRDPGRSYSIKELSRIAKIRGECVNKLLRPAQLVGAVKRTAPETPGQPKRFALTSADDPSESGAKAFRGQPRLKMARVNPLSILSDEFPTARLSCGWVIPAVPRSVFEIAGGLSS